MRINRHVQGSHLVDIYLNGKQVSRPFEVDDVAGTVWAAYEDVNGNLVSELQAERGAFICDGIQVIQLKGNVEIRNKESIVESYPDSFVELNIYQKQ